MAENKLFKNDLSLPPSKYLQQHEKQTTFCPRTFLTLSSLEYHITL